MKKSILLLTAAMICGIFFAACEKDEGPMGGGPIEYDKTLAGSVHSLSHITEAEGSYDGVPYQDLNPYESSLGIRKVSDTEISLYCDFQWGETLLNLSIPVVPLSGVAYNVTFDLASSDATVTLNQAEYSKIRASAKGWIKNTMLGESRMDPLRPKIKCGIAIECEIDGKKLDLNISEVSERPF